MPLNKRTPADEHQKMIQESARFIRQKTVGGIVSKTGIVLGSGIGKLGEKIENPIVIPYSDIPHFPSGNTIGHKSMLIYGELNGERVIAMQGRFHCYQGFSLQEVTFPIDVMDELGVEKLILTNAAGGVNPTFELGDIMLIDDHLNLMFESPLIGENLEERGPRFLPANEPYSVQLQRLAQEVAQKQGLQLRIDGVFGAIKGPAYETRAEIKFLRMIGVDAIGMSTIPEVHVANHCGMQVLAFSIITDKLDSTKRFAVSGKEVVDIAEQKEPELTRLIMEIIPQMNH